MKRTILIADGEPESLARLEETFIDAFDEVILCVDGSSALARARERVPDLVIVSDSLARLSGLEVCRRLRRDERFRFTPIVIASEIGALYNPVQAFEAGASDFVLKPLNPLDLIQRVQQHLDVAERRRRMDAEFALTWSREERGPIFDDAAVLAA